MILEVGNIWSVFETTDIFCFTANSVITQNTLVMGSGFAKQVKTKLPGIEYRLVKAMNYQSMFGFVVVDYRDYKIGAFQTKLHWRIPSTPGIIENSCAKLLEYIQTHQPIRVDLNYPGIGLGGLSKDVVYPIIKELPDIVHIWEKRRIQYGNKKLV